MKAPQNGRRSSKGINRRTFLGSAAGVAAGTAGVRAIGGEAQERAAAERTAPAPTTAQLERDTGDTRPPAPEGTVKRPGSDLMVQVLKDLDIEYIAGNPGSSFEGLQESIINYGDPPNRRPEFITALHEESAVDMAHGYAKAEGRPMAVLLHGTVGLLHASMAIYQAFHDQVPILMIAGRDDGFIPEHTADDMAGVVRSFTKWDTHPTTLNGSLSALQRAYNEAITPPQGPVLVVMDAERQKEEAGNIELPAYAAPRTSAIDATQARGIASKLVAASNPRLRIGRLRTPRGVQDTITLAEMVGASVETSATQGPMSFPQRHPLCGPGADTSYDYVLGLEKGGEQTAIISPHIRSVGGRDPMNINFGGIRDSGSGRHALPPRDERAKTVITADAEESLPKIIDEARQHLTSNKRRTVAERSKRHAKANEAAYEQALAKAVQEKKRRWNSSPITTARIYAELWPLIKDEDWCLSSPSIFTQSHHTDLWEHNRHYSYLGGHGAGGIGYTIGASVGAGLAARGRSRIVIDIQGDGDINYAPGALWTAAHHRLPLLIIMHNNRAWHQELMFVQYMTGVRRRGTDRAHIGTTLRTPHINYAELAQAYGVLGEGPISDPTNLNESLRRGIEVVKQGHPYLIDVIAEPR